MVWLAWWSLITRRWGWVTSRSGLVRPSDENRVGATAVQIVHKRGRAALGIDHIGSAHDEDHLALLLETARAFDGAAITHATP